MMDQSKSHSPAKPSAKASKERFLILHLWDLLRFWRLRVDSAQNEYAGRHEPTATELAIRDLKSSLNMPAFSC